MAAASSALEIIMHKRRALVFLSFVGLVTFAPVQAQDFGPQGVFDMGMLTNTLANRSTSRLDSSEDGESNTFYDRSGNLDLRQLKQTPVTQKLTRTLSYSPSKVRRRENLAQFISKTRALDKAGADQLEAMFASMDIVTAADSEMRKVGLRSDNVADAYAIWWVVAWHAVQGRESEPDAKTIAAVRQQAVNALLATGRMEEASDATKQEMAEALIVQAAMVDGANDQMRGNRAQSRDLAIAVNKGAKAMGLDLTSMTLTPEGFQPRRGSDAGAAIEGHALAATLAAYSPPVASDDNTATYAFLAAAGGAGHAAMFMAGCALGRKG